MTELTLPKSASCDFPCLSVDEFECNPRGSRFTSLVGMGFEFG